MDLSAAVEAVERWTSPRIRTWSADWRHNLARWVEPSLGRVGDVEWGAQIRDQVRLPVADPLQWANRRVELSNGHWAIAGIRFRGRDITKPFVDVVATTLAPEPADLAALAEILPQFDAFSPRCLRVSMPDPEERLALLRASKEFPGTASPDLLILAAPLDRLRRQPASSRIGLVTLDPCDPEAAASRVAAMYRELQPSRPQLLQWATPADATALEAAAAQELLFDIRVGGLSAGVVAVEREDAYGFTGFSVQEIVLDAAHRGQRLATATLQKLCGEISARADDVLWGHIHPDNIPSLRNALASGREIVAAHVWLTPPDYPGMPT